MSWLTRAGGIAAWVVAAACAADDIAFIDLRTEEVGAGSAVVRFDTSVPTSCEAEYGTSEDALLERATDPSMADGELARDHEVWLTELASDTTVYWRARATDAEGTTTYSDVQSFRTLAEDAEDGALTNVALLSAGATITDVSSNFGGAANDETWGIEHAFDGQMATEWSSHGDGDDAFVVVAFGQTRAIERVAYRSREMTNGTSIVTRIRVALETASGTETLGPWDTPDPDETYVFDLDAPIDATSARLDVVESTGGNTGAREIQFFVSTD